MTNTMTCVMKHEVWTWYRPSHLVPTKFLCSRCEPCTNTNYRLERTMYTLIMTRKRSINIVNCITSIAGVVEIKCGHYWLYCINAKFKKNIFQ